MINPSLNYIFHRKDEDKYVPILKEDYLWSWEALYNDGTRLDQFDENGIFHQIAEIDQSKLHVLRMVSHLHNHAYAFIFDPQHHELVLFTRRGVLGYNTSNPQKYNMYVFGYKTTVKRSGDFGGDVTINVLNVIMPNGEMVTTDDVNKLSVEAE